MTVRLAHLCFHTNHFDQMTAFYRDTLGLPVKFDLRLPDGRIFGRYFSLGETSFLEVFDHKGAIEMWGGTADEVARHPDSAYQHFCLQIQDLDAFRAEVIRRGCMVTEITTGMDNSRQAWIKDPDGNAIELMEYTDKSLQIAP